ncbi:carbon-nitrogen family hydrolase [bacterium]|nr:carbon-nitrogen family hydrolase [bacterium]
MKIRLVQFQPVFEKAANLAKALNLANSEGIEKTDVVVFPELFTTGYQLQNISRIAENEETLTKVSGFAKATKTNVVAGSIAFKNLDGKISNTSFIFSREGKLLASYSKIHLFKLMEEEKYLKAGNETVVFEFDGIKCGIVICYDLRFPEITRKLALQGVEIIFVPMEWPFPRTEVFRTLLKARAIENQCFVVGNNVVGAGLQEGIIFEGKSAVANPYGDFIGEMGNREGFLDVEIDTELVKKYRNQIQCFQDRREDVY